MRKDDNMWKTMTAGVTALSLALAPVPAAAEGFNEEDFGKFLFGLVAAVAVGNLLKSANGRDDDDDRTLVHDRGLDVIPRAPVVRGEGRGGRIAPRDGGHGADWRDRDARIGQGWHGADDWRGGNDWRDGHGWRGGHDWRDDRDDGYRGNRGNGLGHGPVTRTEILPYTCLNGVDTRFGDVRMFGRNCLRNAGVRIDRLPEECSVRVYGENGVRNGYDPLCLRQNGYRADRW